MAVSTDMARVLVIDDEPIVGKTLEIVFKNAGHDVLAVESAETALVLLEVVKWVPQFAIIDVHLPGMNGIDLATKLKAQYPEVRVCLFSGRAGTADLLEEASQQVHSFDIIAKPVHPSVFLEMLASTPLDEDGSDVTPRGNAFSETDDQPQSE
jgi:DNA-binding NtrC family response regulator